MTDRHIEFYFDPVSPYVWLASTQLDRIRQQSNLEIVAKPILFAGLLKANEHKGPAEIEVKRIYTFTDVLRRAATYGLEVQGPPHHPFNPLLGLRTSIAIEDNRKRLQYARQLLDATWGKGKDIAVEQNIKQIATGCDIDPEWLVSCAQNPKIKQKLIDETQFAIELGVFGVPTFRVDDQIFWGDDRINELLRYLDGETIDQQKLEQILSTSEAIKS